MMMLEFTPGKIVIITHGGRAMVCRVRDDGIEGEIKFSKAKNWENLENAAISAVEAQGGAVNTFLLSYYECPSELAAQADWHE